MRKTAKKRTPPTHIGRIFILDTLRRQDEHGTLVPLRETKTQWRTIPEECYEPKIFRKNQERDGKIRRSSNSYWAYTYLEVASIRPFTAEDQRQIDKKNLAKLQDHLQAESKHRAELSRKLDKSDQEISRLLSEIQELEKEVEE